MSDDTPEGATPQTRFPSAIAEACRPEVQHTEGPRPPPTSVLPIHGHGFGRMRESGFAMTVTEGPMNRPKGRLGVPRDLASCRIAQVGGYAVEGHVPAEAIRRLLVEKPQGIGLAVPGMPVGSTGMEVEGMEPDTYDVVLFGPAGRGTFERYRGTTIA